MATNFGYRLWTLEVRRERTHTKLDWFDPAFTDRLMEILQLLQGSVAFGSPTFQESSIVGTNERVIGHHPAWRIETVQRYSHRIDVEMTYGQVGDYTTGLNVIGGGDATMTGIAPSRLYRVWIYPPTAGNTGIVVSDVRGRLTSIPDLLVRFLTTEACAIGDDNWLAWRVTPLTDQTRLASIMENGAALGVKLVSHGFDAAGNRTDGQITVAKNGLPSLQLGIVQEVVLRVAGIRDQAQRARAFAQGMAVLVPEVAAVGETEFNDGQVEFIEAGQRVRLTPDNLDELWTYPLGQEYPSSERLLRTAAAKLRIILPLMGVPVDLGSDDVEE